MTKVKAGQIWEDRDSREGGRRVRVVVIEHGTRAYCAPVPGGEGRRWTRIRLTNLRRRFRLVEDPA